MSKIIRIEENDQQGNTVEAKLFGTNYLFHSQDVENFDELTDIIELTGARYPGGTITELHFDITNPDAVPDSFSDAEAGRFTPLSDFLEACNQSGLDPTIVIPTSHAILENGQLNASYIDDVKEFVLATISRVGEGNEFPNIQIESFEIGNEYWGVEGMTAAEYGAIANKMSTAIQEVLDGHFGDGQAANEPNILIQMGNPVRGGADFEEGGVFYDLQPGSERAEELGLTERDFDQDGNLRWLPKVRIANEQIIDELDGEAREAIDGLVEHYYYRQSAGQNPSLEYNEHSTNFIELQASHWRDEGFDDPLFITEWNMSIFDYTNFGQVGAGTLIAQMSHMIQMGVESAFIWPLQHNAPNDIAGHFEGDPVLGAIGAAFQHMADTLPGLEFEGQQFSENDVKLISYGNGLESVDYLISRSESPTEISVVFDEWIGQETEVTIRRLYVDSDNKHWEPGKGFIEVPEYRDHDATSTITTETVTIGESGTLDLTLRPFEIVVVEYELASASNEIIGTDGDDLIIGTPDDDLINGRAGNDTLYGGSGNDVFLGGDGNDRLGGGHGDDKIWGGEGSDVVGGGNGDDHIYGQGGSDTLWGGNGNDLIYGGDGDDHIGAGSGDDLLDGGAGDDTLWGAKGNDEIIGGEGNDVIGAGHGNDTAYGGGGSDTLWGGGGHDVLFGEFGDDLLVGGSGNDLLLGGDGSDQLWGSDGSDTLNGGDGRDFLNGGLGDDWLFAGGGKDTLLGGEGADTFIFQDSSTEVGDIRDFNAMDGDLIKISASLLDEHLRDKDISEILAEIFHVGGNYGAALKMEESETQIYLKGIFSLDEILDHVVIIEDEEELEDAYHMV